MSRAALRNLPRLCLSGALRPAPSADSAHWWALRGFEAYVCGLGLRPRVNYDYKFGVQQAGLAPWRSAHPKMDFCGGSPPREVIAAKVLENLGVSHSVCVSPDLTPVDARASQRATHQRTPADEEPSSACDFEPRVNAYKPAMAREGARPPRLDNPKR